MRLNKYQNQQATPAVVLNQLKGFEKRIKVKRTRFQNTFIIKLSALLIIITLLLVYLLTPLYEMI